MAKSRRTICRCPQGVNRARRLTGIPARIGRVEIGRVMVLAMSYDRCAALSVACFAAACGPKVEPNGPASEPGPIGKVQRATSGSAGRLVVVGGVCPQGAGGRPAVAGLVMPSKGQWRAQSAAI